MKLSAEQKKHMMDSSIESLGTYPGWWFPKIMVPPNGWFIMENPIKMDNLGIPLFSETPRWWQLNYFSPLYEGQHLPKQGLKSNQKKEVPGILGGGLKYVSIFTPKFWGR